MRNRKLCLCFLVAVAIVLVNILSIAALTDIQRDFILQFHNDKRFNDTPRAVNMRVMTYDLGLEALAQRWVNRCKFEHPSLLNKEYISSGQNIGATGGMSENVTVDAILRAWYAEKLFYNYASRACSKVCGHYTQMVWAATDKIGCAIQTCQGIFPGIEAFYFACQYVKRGNIIGQRPYKV